MKRGLIIGLLVGLSAAAGTAWGQTAQPTMYLVTTTPGGTRVYWFETARDECYVFGGGGISCLRKVGP